MTDYYVAKLFDGVNWWEVGDIPDAILDRTVLFATVSQQVEEHRNRKK